MSTSILLTAANDTNGKRTYRTSFTGNNEWYTPARYIELAREVMGQIDVDPASNDHAQKTVKAATYYTAETNGLDKEWLGKVWMNPPYSQPEIVHFIQKLVDEYQSGRCTEAVVLTHNSTDTRWFRTLYDAADAFCFYHRPHSVREPGRGEGSARNGAGIRLLRTGPEPVCSRVLRSR